MTRKEKSILLQGLLLFTGLAYLFMVSLLGVSPPSKKSTEGGNDQG